MNVSPQTRAYDPLRSVAFRKTKDRYGGLSNMASGFPIVVNGIRIRTAEALYQACRYPTRPDVQRLIIEERSPMTAKMKPESTEGRPWGQPLKKLEGAPLNLG